MYISKFIPKLTCFYLRARPVTKKDFCKLISTKGYSPSQVSFPYVFPYVFWVNKSQIETSGVKPRHELTTGIKQVHPAIAASFELTLYVHPLEEQVFYLFSYLSNYAFFREREREKGRENSSSTLKSWFCTCQKVSLSKLFFTFF